MSVLKKVLIVFGTRPEAIKMLPVVQEIEKTMEVKVCVSAQHRDMLDQVLNIFGVKPDFDLDVMRQGQDLFDITSRVLQGMKHVISEVQPDVVLVHGDTTTTMATAMASFYLHVPIGHIEAGLRTYNIQSPFPEEFNRQLTTRVTRFHFAPTERARQNLLHEHVFNEHIYVTGNTVVDALFSVLEKAKIMNYPTYFLAQLPFLRGDKNVIPRIILVTGHRRENFGQRFDRICQALLNIAGRNPNIQIIYPVHPNPKVYEPVHKKLSGIKNIHLVAPMDYLLFVKMMDISYLILTDSGGIQEEAPSLGKPVLVMRDTTERQEAVEAGTVRLVGAETWKIVEAVEQLLTDDIAYKKMVRIHNPYGEGCASAKICEVLEEEL